MAISSSRYGSTIKLPKTSTRARYVQRHSLLIDATFARQRSETGSVVADIRYSFAVPLLADLGGAYQVAKLPGRSA